MSNPVMKPSVKPQHHRRRPFLHRFLLALGLSAGIVGFSLGLGTLGYHFIARLNWVDSLLNASMILTGMGPVDKIGRAHD